MGSRPFGVGPAGDDEFAAVEAFRFDPGAAVAWEVGLVEALGDDAFEAVAAGGAAERLAVAGLMGAKVDAGGRRAEQGRKAALALGERHGGEGLA